MQNANRLAFIKLRDFSHINESVLKLLKENFQNYQIDEVDILEDLMLKEDVVALYACFKEYGIHLLSKRITISDCFLRTSYVHKKIRQKIIKRLSNKGYTFTFQTQSLFDASVPGIHHFVYTDHTHMTNLTYPGYDQKRFLGEKWINLERKIYENSTINFTMSSNISRSLINDYSCNPEKVVCVFSGSNIQVEEAEELDDLRYSRRNILFVGIDWERKGGPALVEAFKSVLNSYPDATLTIVGCTPKLDIPNCIIAGRVPLSEVKKYFKTATLFCLPTTIEPFGIVFLEAMAHKLPVIGTNIGAIPDFIHEGKNGYLVEPNDSYKISRCIIDLFDSTRKIRSFGEYGHKLFWDRYTWEMTGLRIRDIIMKNINKEANSEEK